MYRSVQLFCLWLLVLYCIAPSAAQQPTPDAPPAKPMELRNNQEQNAKLFQELKRGLLTLAQKLDRSDRAEDKDRAKTIRAALEIAEKANVDNQFKNLIGGLSKGANKPQDLNQLIGQNSDLEKALQEMLAVLMTDDESARLKAEIDRLERILKEAEEIKRKQEIARAMTENSKTDKDKLAKNQADLAAQTKDLAARMGAKKASPSDAKKSSPKDSPPKDSPPTDPKGSPKDSPPGSGKPKPGSPKPGAPKDGQPSDSPPPPPSDAPPPPPQDQTPGRKKIEEAYPYQKEAEKGIEKDKRPDAAGQQDKAIEKITEAIEALKKRLKQLREEEMLKVLAALEARCNRMLAMQIEVYEATKVLHGTITKNQNQKTNAERQKSQQQADKEQEIVIEAEKALKLLEGEGSSVVFALVLSEVQVDLTAVKRRLEECYVDTDTQGIEENIIAMLREMIQALKKAQQDMKNPPPPPPPGSSMSKPNQKLIDQLAELKLIRALQLQVNGRTITSGKKYEGEQAGEAIVQSELRQLAERQANLQEKLHQIVTGANR